MIRQKVIGIIGGIAPPSTIDYYQRIISGFQKQTGSNHYPSIIINSIDMTEMLDLVSKKDFSGLVNFLKIEIEKLAQSGSDFVVLASNTPHIVFEQLQKNSVLPLISIVDTATEYAKSRGFKKLGLFGTKFTMQSGFYQTGFAKLNMEIVVPSPESQEYIHSKYMNEFVKGIYLPETKKKLINIINELIRQDNIEAVVLGGTELPFILDQKDFQNLSLLNTTEIHVAKILEYALRN